MNDSQIFFIWGQESFLIDREIKKIISKIKQTSGEEPEVLYLDADELSPMELMEQLEFSPLFALQRVVIINRPAWLAKSRRKSSRTEDISKILGDYIQRDNGAQVLIITADEHAANNRLVKMLDKNAQVLNIKALTGKSLKDWIKEEFASRNCTVAPEGVNLLASSGQDMHYLLNLIEKISLATRDETVDINEIETQLNSKEEIKVFKLTDGLLRRDAKISFAAFYKLLDQGDHPIFFLYMIVRQFMQLGKVKYYMEKGYHKAQIIEETGIKEFALRGVMNNARNFTWKELQRLFRLFLEADVSFKTTGQDPRMVIEMLIIEICSRPAN
ncbi:MAG: DNA polymerase III subunit delta [Syntrophomonadaceae bacterium]|nr:DNA polymerase III subunit delta [Syntrophomonadaceae bacterium]